MDPPWSPTPPPPPSTLDAPFLTSAPRHEQSCCGFLPLCDPDDKILIQLELSQTWSSIEWKK
ncbi:hypothetical protein C5167_001452 [Papaver somniferum]|uniref:Uncharacterized protein n=1 Tax=Papaver somniferum TaxID=3469 RepID=A0A4Y7KU45_PAPSO|nr:hypothetical protein C5167_001452 [Papaver somniferum]